MHTVIVGGGFAGVKTALELAKRRTGKITLISDKPYFLYHAALYATATGSNPEESAIDLADIFADYNSVNIVKDTIIALDPARNMVISKKGSYVYDTLVLALGSVTSFLDTSGIQGSSFGVKTLEEIHKFHQHIKNEMIKDRHLDKNYVIVGGGPTGVELAGVLAPYIQKVTQKHMLKRARVHVQLVEAKNRLLPALSKSASSIIKQRLEKIGVKVILGRRVRSFDRTHITLDGRKIPTKTVIWTAGQEINPFFKNNPEYFDITESGKVVVNPYLEAYRDIYVLGDCAEVKGSGTAPAALRMGTYLAKHLERKLVGSPLRPYRPRRSPVTIPVGDNWAYVECLNIYTKGRLGHVMRRRFELSAYRQILPESQARAAWSAHNIKNMSE
ncbi:NAD(P)/FAD-dependent oxidoreductase [Candidatus Saccharibacteria bacterium]|jgi:NADH dehydrogenase FAD-containing subunit|nr:NAD(P)/FAD-dependent oxidoreductase [Candidatus Saccharibacteria bacterium]